MKFRIIILYCNDVIKETFFYYKNNLFTSFLSYLNKKFRVSQFLQIVVFIKNDLNDYNKKQGKKLIVRFKELSYLKYLDTKITNRFKGFSTEINAEFYIAPRSFKTKLKNILSFNSLFPYFKNIYNPFPKKTNLLIGLNYLTQKKKKVFSLVTQ